jgi:hypothetical protein
MAWFVEAPISEIAILPIDAPYIANIRKGASIIFAEDSSNPRIVKDFSDFRNRPSLRSVIRNQAMGPL